MPAGLHIVRKRRPGKSMLWYVYAWRGGPLIQRSEGGRPKVTAALTDLAAEARKVDRQPRGDTIAKLIGDYRAPTTPEWAKLAASTRANYATWLERIREEFGDAPVSAFDDRKMRGDILAWRDKWMAQPRSADAAIQVMSALLSWGIDRGRLEKNIAKGITQLYDADRSEIIWEPADFEAFEKAASVEVWEGVQLAALTGLRRGDLVNLPWTAVGEHAIVWRTAKSRGKNLATVPLLPETKILLAQIKARHAAYWEATRPDRRKPLPATVLSSSYWRPWTAMGFGSRFNDAKADAGIKKHLHDLRGTFVTRCCIAGLTDEEIADIVGWDTKDIASIRARYADQSRVVIAIGERLAKAARS
jgi:integrase